MRGEILYNKSVWKLVYCTKDRACYQPKTEEVIIMKNKISVSLLSADMMNLEREIRRVEESGAEMLHFDVMDGVFVNNITYGLPVLEQVRRITNMPLDVHLMITDPLKYAERFVKSGADIVSFHIESNSDTAETLKVIKESGAKACIAIKPSTKAEAVYKYLEYLDMVLVMTVEPGFGGQSFIAETVGKIGEIRKKLDTMGLATDIEVDGGINDVTSELVKSVGANVLVSGSYLFGSDDMAKSVRKIGKEVLR